jgi:hypothetical protein
MMKWIREGEPHRIPGWVDFLAKGPGTLPMHGTGGAYTVLEYLSKHLQWRNIVELERGVGRRWPIPWAPGRFWYERYIDIVVRDGAVEKFIEIKNLHAGAAFTFASQVAFDIGRAMTAAGGNLTQLAQRLAQHEYVLRGDASQMAAVIAGVREKIRKVLLVAGPQSAQHVNEVKITPLGWPLPF